MASRTSWCGAPGGDRVRVKYTHAKPGGSHTKWLTPPESGFGSSFFGNTLAVGDFNHDGFSDLAIGAPVWTNTVTVGTNRETQGALYFYNGSKTGLHYTRVQPRLGPGTTVRTRSPSGRWRRPRTSTTTVSPTSRSRSMARKARRSRSSTAGTPGCTCHTRTSLTTSVRRRWRSVTSTATVSLTSSSVTTPTWTTPTTSSKAPSRCSMAPTPGSPRHTTRRSRVPSSAYGMASWCPPPCR